MAAAARYVNYQPKREKKACIVLPCVHYSISNSESMIYIYFVAEAILGEEAEKETVEEQLAASVGIQFRTDAGLNTTIRNENDDQRFHWHRYGA